MTLKVHFVQHASYEQPGFIEEWSKKRGHVLSGTLLYRGEVLPDPKEVDLLISLGGPQTPLRLGEFPYLVDEIGWIARLIKAGRPMLGFCLGSQLIAEALGAATLRSPYKEVGVFPVQLTADGRQDPILGHFPAEFEALHWHHDMPGIPQGGVLLAKSAGCPQQAFRYGERVYGFQFHLEPTRESVAPLLRNGAADLTPGRFTQRADTIQRADFAAMNQLLEHALDSLAGVASTA